MDNKEQKVSTILDFGPIEDTSKQIIKVVGVGGGGCNAVKNMYEEGIANVSFAVCNTDSQVLANSPIPTKLLLGESGLGAGADPERGKQEAINTKEQVKKLFSDNTKMCFITAGMGGGTGTGAAPIIAGVAHSMGILTIGIVTIPFFFEKKNKIIKALKGVEEMRKNVDSLLIINNESICDIYSDSKIPLKDAFKSADQILCNAAKSISELITLEGNINLDFRDVETTMRNGGGAIMAIGRAKGERRVEKAIVNALESPLLYGSDITKAKNILFNIYTSDDAPLFVSEMREVDSFMYELNPDINVIWGTSDDNTLGEDAKVIILATGLDNRFLPAEQPGENQTDDYYDKIISKLYREPMDVLRPKPIKEQVEKAEPVGKIEENVVPEQTVKESAVEEPTAGVNDMATDTPVEVNIAKKEKVQEIEEKEEAGTIEEHHDKVPKEEPKPKTELHHKPTFLERMKDRLAKNLGKFVSDEDD